MRTGAPTFKRLVEDHGARADFAFVYILEAHAVDEWPMPVAQGVLCSEPQARTDDERCARARRYAQNYELPSTVRMLVDPIGDEFVATYAAWPERFYIITQGRLALIDNPLPDAGHLPIVLTQWLEFDAADDECPEAELVPPFGIEAMWPRRMPQTAALRIAAVDGAVATPQPDPADVMALAVVPTTSV
eukprot:Amastigsp_a340885_26.p2 type:complete len:189 gc:universal Amastigsp_a340885_26:547-1113(+)